MPESQPSASVQPSHQQLVQQLVRGYFTPSQAESTAGLTAVSREEVIEAVVLLLQKHGYFPLHAAMSEGPPPIYLGEQIRTLPDGRFLVVNCDFYQHASQNGATTRLFTDAHDAVTCFLRGQMPSHMRGIPVV